MRWLKTLLSRMFSKKYIYVRNRKLRDTIHMLDDLVVNDEKLNSIATDILVRTFKSDVLIKYKDTYNIDDKVLQLRLSVCQSAANVLFNNIAIYQPYLHMGRYDLITKEYVDIAYSTLPDLLLELMQYGPTPEQHEEILSNLTHHMDVVRRIRRDLFTINSNQNNQ